MRFEARSLGSIIRADMAQQAQATSRWGLREKLTDLGSSCLEHHVQMNCFVSGQNLHTVTPGVMSRRYY